MYRGLEEYDTKTGSFQSFYGKLHLPSGILHDKGQLIQKPSIVTQVLVIKALVIA